MMTGPHLFAFLLALYVLTGAGYLALGDEETMYRVTRHLVDGTGPAIGRETVQLPALGAVGFLPATPSKLETTSAVPGVGGRLVSKYGLGQSLLGVPLFGLGRLLDVLWPRWPQLGPRLALALLNPLALAATGWLLFHFVMALGYPVRLALVTALAFGLASMAWPYVNTWYPQPATGFFLLLAAFAFNRWQHSRASRWLWWLGTALGAALLLRATAVIAVPGVVVVLWLESRSWPERRQIGWRVGLPLALAVGVTLGYNWLRFGHPLNSGYYEVAWTTPLALGLYGLLFSPGKGVFLYTPLLLLAVGALPLFFQKHRRLAWLVTLWWLAFLAFYAPYNFWTGGVNWGPRFLLPLLPVSLLPLAVLLHQPKIRLAWPLFVTLFALGVLIQLPAVLVDHVRYLEQQRDTGDERFYDRTLYQPADSPIAHQWASALKVLGEAVQPERRAVAAQVIQQMPLPPADSLPNRQSAQRVLQTQFIRLNLPALWWAHLPLWGVPGWVVVLLMLPWLLLFGWGAAGFWVRKNL